MKTAPTARLQPTLVVDVGGTHLKLLASGRKKRLKLPSGPKMTPARMAAAVKRAARDWKYERVSLGYPGSVVDGHPVKEPHNLGPGWVGFDFRSAFNCPVKVINDAAMQALGSYQGGFMLFLGLGTGLGSAMIVDGVLVSMELAHLPYKHGKTYEDYLGKQGLKIHGEVKWRRNVFKIVRQLKEALGAHYVVLGGGNAKKLKSLPKDMRLGDNDDAFAGGFRLWEGASRESKQKRG